MPSIFLVVVGVVDAVATSSAVGRARAAAQRDDLPRALSELGAARLAQCSGLTPAWSAILESLGRRRSPALLFFCELMYHDGIALRDLDDETRAVVEDLLPVELAASDQPILSRLAKHPRFATRRLPEKAADDSMVWMTPSPLRDVDCAGDHQRAVEALERARTERSPVVLRNVGAQWKADWTLDTLAQCSHVVCRVSPSRAVAFCRESHPLVAGGIVAPPSVTVTLAGWDAAKRLGRDDETLYIQALAHPRLMDDVNGLDFARDKTPGPPLMARLWASKPGTSSPLHFDLQDSHLVQVVGYKRMVLWPPDALPFLDPYEDGHPLARRCRFDVLGPTAPSLTPDAARLVRDSPVEATLRPGDAIWFPRLWAHHTVAVDHDSRAPNDTRQTSDLSISLSLREEDGRVVGA